MTELSPNSHIFPDFIVHVLIHIANMFYQESEYKKLGEELLTAAWRTLNSPDWKLEKKLDNGDMVQVGATSDDCERI